MMDAKVWMIGSWDFADFPCQCMCRQGICHGSVTHGRVQVFLDFYVEGAEKGRRKWLIDGCTG